MVMSAARHGLVFVVPVRHPDSVKQWSRVKADLLETARSIAAQTDPAWRAVVVANAEADLPDLPTGFEVRRVELPLPQLPDPKLDQEAFFEAVRLDKGRRILTGMQDAAQTEHIMVVDFDDWVSRKLAAHVRKHPTWPGWYFSRGYVSDGTRLLYLHDKFSGFCGTSHIIRRDVFDLPVGEVPEATIKRRLGSHVFLRHDLAGTSQALSPLPFAGAVYRIDNPQSTSGTSGILAVFLPRWLLRRQPLEYLRRLFRLRRLGRATASEFAIKR